MMYVLPLYSLVLFSLYSCINKIKFIRNSYSRVYMDDLDCLVIGVCFLYIYIYMKLIIVMGYRVNE